VPARQPIPKQAHAVHRRRRLQDDKPVVAGVVAGHHEVYGGDEETFTDGLWLARLTATDIADAEHPAKTEAIENAI
jgi:hypothetical protein